MVGARRPSSAQSPGGLAMKKKAKKAEKKAPKKEK
jgi:hypothetical protein